MKKIVLLSLIAVMLILSACNTEPGNTSSSSSSSVQDSMDLVISSDANEDQNSLPEKDTVHDSSSEKEHKNTESTSENSVANISWDSLISENNKRLRFSVAYDEDKAYAIILDSSGAGQSFYRVFITVDGGKTCAENSRFKLLNFCDYNMITLENGDILAFQNWPDDTSIDTNICIYGVDKQTDNFFEKRINNWFDDFNIDEDINFITEAEYSDNYFFYIKIKEKLNEKNVLFSGTVEIDSETYLPKNIIRDEEE